MFTLALETLSAGWQAALFGIATVLLLVAALAQYPTRPALVPLGLAFFTFVFAFNALALA